MNFDCTYEMSPDLFLWFLQTSLQPKANKVTHQETVQGPTNVSNWWCHTSIGSAGPKSGKSVNQI